MRITLAIAVALMLVIAGCAQAPGAGTAPETTASEGTTTADDEQRDVIKPDDPDGDVLGWEEGLWYNETVNVTPEDGLNDTELDKVVSRSMARVERIRGLEFEERVPVDIQTRESFGTEQANRSLPPDRRLFDNAKFESLFMINESTDSIAVQNRNSGTSIGGYYSPSENSIVVVADAGNRDSPRLDEFTLAHELTHALQDQHFDLSSYNQSTRELHNARDGLIEGEGNYVQHLYEQRCANEWAGECFSSGANGGAGGELANMGVYLLNYQPYSDGPAFVRGVQREGGWEAVNDLYERPPESTEQVIHPDKYGADDPAAFDVEDASDEAWTRMRFDQRPNYASVGEAGVFSMFMYPYYKTEGETQLVPARQFFNLDESGNLQQLDPLNYNSSYSDGWDGDKLVVYTSDTTAENETGYVWKSVWDSEAEAREFVEGYRQLLQFNDATAVDGRENTWRIEGEFNDAFYVEQRGDTVVVVNAPSVEELSAVREGAAPER